MTVNDLWPPFEPGAPARDRYRYPRKQGKSGRVVVPRVARRVEVGITGPAVGRRVINEPEARIASRQSTFEQRDRGVDPVDSDRRNRFQITGTGQRVVVTGQ